MIYIASWTGGAPYIVYGEVPPGIFKMTISGLIPAGFLYASRDFCGTKCPKCLKMNPFTV